MNNEQEDNSPPETSRPTVRIERDEELPETRLFGSGELFETSESGPGESQTSENIPVDTQSSISREDLEVELDDRSTIRDVVPAEDGDEVARAEEAKNATVADAAPEPSLIGTVRLENAMVGRPYSTRLNLRDLKIQSPRGNLRLDEERLKRQLGEIGLTHLIERDVLGIEGTPLTGTQGDRAFDLDYTYDGGRTILRQRLELLVNSDPKSLWKEKEPPSDLPYPKSHKDVRQIRGNGYNIIAASRRGRSHAHEGTHRDDDFAIDTTETGWDILIVADGAGSAEFSRRGSFLACQTGAEFLRAKIREHLDPKFADLMKTAATVAGEKELKTLLYQVLCGAAFAAFKRIENEAAETNRHLKDFSTTFLASIVKRFEGRTFVASFGIGDGAIGVYDGDEIELMNSPDGGEFSGQTRFLTMREVVGNGGEMMRRIKFGVFDQFTTLMLMTDGISDPKFGTDNNLLAKAKWHELGAELNREINFAEKDADAAAQLYNWMDFWSQGEHDDRTLAILYRDFKTNG